MTAISRKRLGWERDDGLPKRRDRTYDEELTTAPFTFETLTTLGRQLSYTFTMTGDLALLFDKPLLLFVVLFVGGIAGMKVEGFVARQRREAWKSKNKSRWEKKIGIGPVVSGKWSPKSDAIPFKVPDAADQLRIVMSADFSIQPLLNKSEARLFWELDRLVQARNSGWQVMAQVSLGEILRTKEKDAYGCINAKRVDLLLVDGECQPIAAIEYQGGGHHQGTAAARDAVKKEALRRARIGYHEVIAGVTTRAELKRMVEKLVPDTVGSK